MFRRCEGAAEAEDSLLGLVPAPGEIDTEGLDLTNDEMRELFSVDPSDLRDQIPQMQQHFAQFGDRLPDRIRAQMQDLEKRLD